MGDLERCQNEIKVEADVEMSRSDPSHFEELSRFL